MRNWRVATKHAATHVIATAAPIHPSDVLNFRRSASSPCFRLSDATSFDLRDPCDSENLKDRNHKKPRHPPRPHERVTAATEVAQMDRHEPSNKRRGEQHCGDFNSKIGSASTLVERQVSPERLATRVLKDLVHAYKQDEEEERPIQGIQMCAKRGNVLQSWVRILLGGTRGPDCAERIVEHRSNFRFFRQRIECADLRRPPDTFPRRTGGPIVCLKQSRRGFPNRRTPQGPQPVISDDSDPQPGLADLCVRGESVPVAITLLTVILVVRERVAA